MTNPKNIDYFKNNESAVRTLIVNENQRRYRENFHPLTEAEIDGLITQLVDGTPQDQIKFPEPIKKNQAGQTKKADINFSITEVSNGYLLKYGIDQHIFKNLRELVKIFKTVFFKNHELNPEKQSKTIKKLTAVNG